MSASAWTAKRRSNTEGISAKVQYSNAVVTTNALLYRGAAGCGGISYQPIVYPTYPPCRLYTGNNFIPTPIPTNTLDGGNPSTSGSTTFDGGSPSGAGPYTYDGGSP